MLCCVMVQVSCCMWPSAVSWTVVVRYPVRTDFSLLDGVKTDPGAHRCPCPRVPRSFLRE